MTLIERPDIDPADRGDPAVRAARRRKRIRRLVYSVLLSIAAVSFVAAFYLSEDEPEIVRPQAVRAVSPIEEAQEVRQASIYAELAPGFDGELAFDSRPIPLDQTDKLQTGGNRISFTPGPEKEFTSFDEGRHCAEVRYWPVVEGPDSFSTYRWCFDLH